MPIRPDRRMRIGALAAPAALFALLTAPAALADVTSLRVMLSPVTAAAGTLPDAAKARLDALAGVTLGVSGFTRTGAVDLTLPVAIDDATAKTIVKRLREDRAVLWAEVPRSVTLAKSGEGRRGRQQMGYRFMLKLAPGVAPDWARCCRNVGADRRAARRRSQDRRRLCAVAANCANAGNARDDGGLLQQNPPCSSSIRCGG